MKILVKVTKEILIKTSRCNNAFGINCAIAAAIREMFPHSITGNRMLSIYTEENFIKLLNNPFNLYRKDQNVIYTLGYPEIAQIQLPFEAMRFIRTFDITSVEHRMNLEPIQFEINVPNEVIDQIGISTAYKVLSESKTLELVSI